MNLADQLIIANGITADDEPTEPTGIWALLFGVPRPDDTEASRIGARRMQVMRERRAKVLAMICEDGETTRKAICDALGVALDTVDADLEALKARGLIAVLYRGGRMFIRPTEGGRK